MLANISRRNRQLPSALNLDKLVQQAHILRLLLPLLMTQLELLRPLKRLVHVTQLGKVILWTRVSRHEFANVFAMLLIRHVRLYCVSQVAALQLEWTVAHWTPLT